MYSNHRTCIFVSYFMGTFIYAGTINRPLRLLTVCDNAANGLLIMLRSPTKLVTNIPPGVGADSSRPYPNIFKYAYPHYQLRVFTSLNTHFHITAHAYPHYQLRVFTSSNTHIHFTEYAFPFPILWVYSYSRAR